MNLPIDPSLISLASLIFSFASFVLVSAVFVKTLGLHKEKNRELSDELTHAVSKKIDESVEKILGSTLEDSRTKIDGEIRKFSEELLRLIHARSAELSAYVDKTQQEQAKQSQFYVANMMAKIETDAKDYRENRFKEIDQEIRQIVLGAAREVIGRAISLSEHEDLVNKALERAKRDKLF